MQIHNTASEDMKITLVDTGKDTLTGGRIKRIKKLRKQRTLHAYYGDGVGNVEIDKLVAFHKKNKKTLHGNFVQPNRKVRSIKY